QSLGAFSLAVNRERDADAMKRALRFVPFLRDSIRRRSIEPVRECPIVGAHGAVRHAHFVVGVGGHSKFCCRVSWAKQTASHHRNSFAGSGLDQAGLTRASAANQAGTSYALLWGNRVLDTALHSDQPRLRHPLRYG